LYFNKLKRSSLQKKDAFYYIMTLGSKLKAEDLGFSVM